MHVTGNKYTFKVSVIGDGRVGKTSLIKKFTKGSFQTDYIKTIGAQFSVFDKKVNGDEILGNPTLYLSIIKDCSTK